MLRIIFRITIQCKKVPGNAWIFFEGPISKTTAFGSFPQIITILDAFNIESRECYDKIIGPLAFSKMHYDQGFQSSGYKEIIVNKETSNKKDSNLWESEITIIKAVESEKQDCLQQEGIIDDIKALEQGQVLQWIGQASEYQTIYFIFPLIVFEGDIYSATFPLNEENLIERKYITLMRNYKSSNYKWNSGIDIINNKYLREYLSLIENDIKLINNCLIKSWDGFIDCETKLLQKHFKPNLFLEKEK